MNIPVRSRAVLAKAPGKIWWLSFLLLGPITGFLLGLCVASFKADRPLLAAGCAAALAGFWIAAPALLSVEISMLPASLRP
jgi:hypothetical protein